MTTPTQRLYNAIARAGVDQDCHVLSDEFHVGFYCDKLDHHPLYAGPAMDWENITIGDLKAVMAEAYEIKLRVEAVIEAHRRMGYSRPCVEALNDVALALWKENVE